MIAEVERTLSQRGLARPGEALWVAVSGGVDSMVLLHVLRELGHPCQVIHVDHGLRGAESDADKVFVGSHCAALGVHFSADRVEVRTYAETTGRSIQMAARELRYELFRARVAEGPHKLALAHHADDAVETLFLHLIRGMGMHGWGTIPYASGALIRPFLDVDREAILRYALRHGIPFREDSGNRDPKYLRNRVRQEVLPLLEEIRDGASRVLRRDVALLREMEIAAQTQVAHQLQALHPDAGAVTQVPLAILRNSLTPRLLLHALLAPHGHHPDEIDRIHRAVLEGATGATFGNAGTRVVVDREVIVIQPLESPPPTWTIEAPDAVPMDAPLHITAHDAADMNLDQGPNVAWLNMDAVRFPIILRPWRPGDRMRPLGLQGRKLVSDILTDAKVPSHRKPSVMVLESAGVIIWLCGHRIAEDARVREGDSRVLRIELT